MRGVDHTGEITAETLADAGVKYASDHEAQADCNFYIVPFPLRSMRQSGPIWLRLKTRARLLDRSSSPATSSSLIDCLPWSHGRSLRAYPRG